MSAKSGIKKIVRRILRKHRSVFYNEHPKDLELKLWVNNISSKPSLHLGKRGIWNKFTINKTGDVGLKAYSKTKRGDKIKSKRLWYET